MHRLKHIIQLTGLSQKEFAERVGISGNALTELFKGRSKGLSEQSLTAIAKEFNVNINWLLTGEGEMFLPKSEKDVTLRTSDGKSIDIPQEIVDKVNNDLNALKGGAKIFEGEINHVRWFFSLPREKQTAILAIAELEDPALVNRIKEVLLFEVEDQRRRKRDVLKSALHQKGEISS